MELVVAGEPVNLLCFFGSRRASYTSSGVALKNTVCSMIPSLRGKSKPRRRETSIILRAVVESARRLLGGIAWNPVGA